MNPTIAANRTRLDDVVREMAERTTHHEHLVALIATLTQRYDALGPRPKGQAAQREKDMLLIELSRLRGAGIDMEGGIPLDLRAELLPLVGTAGLADTRQRLARLTAEGEELRAFLARWPDETTTHPYRYTGQPFRARLHGRELQPGDIVELTEQEARAFRDRFDAISDERAVA